MENIKNKNINFVYADQISLSWGPKGFLIDFREYNEKEIAKVDRVAVEAEDIPWLIEALNTHLQLWLTEYRPQMQEEKTQLGFSTPAVA